jgi:hypothetical protein
MKAKRWILRLVTFAIACRIVSSASAVQAQEAVTVHAVVTATNKLNRGRLTLAQKSIIVDVDNKPQEVFSWTPLRGKHAGLQLALLIDESSSFTFSPQLNDIGTFVEALPPSTQVAIGYMQNSRANISQAFTNNHASAATALWAPMPITGAITNRYPCLSDLVKHWPGGNEDLRREVIMVTDGVDPYSGWSSYCADDPNVQATISDAQKSNVVVYSIIVTRGGLMDSHSLAEKAGQNYLVQVSNATGGKSYSLRLGYPVILATFLFDILCKLDNQYELSFVTATRNTLRPLEVKTTQANTRLRAPEHISIRYRGK